MSGRAGRGLGRPVRRRCRRRRTSRNHTRRVNPIRGKTKKGITGPPIFMMQRPPSSQGRTRATPSTFPPTKIPKTILARRTFEGFPRGGLGPIGLLPLCWGQLDDIAIHSLWRILQGLSPGRPVTTGEVARARARGSDDSCPQPRCRWFKAASVLRRHPAARPGSWQGSSWGAGTRSISVAGIASVACWLREDSSRLIHRS